LNAGSILEGLRGVRLDPRTISSADLAAWTNLADRAAQPNPFFRPEFLLANVIERGLSAELLVVTDGPRWVACLPVHPVAPTRRIPLPTLAALTDWYNFSGMPLIDRDALHAAAAGLIALVRTERRAVAVLIGVFESEGVVGQALAAAASKHGGRLVKVGQFQRGGWYRTTEPHFPGPAFHPRDRAKLARRAVRLAAELGGPLTVVDRTSEPAAWTEFLTMENTGWKASRGNPMGSTKPDEAFFLRMCVGMSRIGCLELVSLEVGGKSVAMECHLIDGRSLWSFKIAHDPAFAWFSPGTQLKYKVIDGFHERAIDLADSCAVPENAHANRLWPDRRTMDTVLLPTGSWLRHVVPLALSARSGARKLMAANARRRARPNSGGSD
jgi:hypothetical protein